MSAASLTTRMMHARGFNLGVALLALIVAAVYFLSGGNVDIDGDRGMALPSANEWFTLGYIDFAAGVAASAATVALMLLLNKINNVLRSMTSLYIALFALMQAGMPNLMTQLYSGSLLAVIVPLCILILLNCYSSPDATLHVFLIFFILSAASMSQYCFIFYVPVILLGCVQMQIFRWRTLSAALLGAITPWWLLGGFGIIELSAIHLPHIQDITGRFSTDNAILTLVTVGFTVLITLLCYFLNVVRTIAYNARARAINGVFTITTLVTLAAMCIDYGNMLCYVPLLNFCAAMEVTHYFSTHRAEKSFIAILLIFATYLALAICQIII